MAGPLNVLLRTLPESLVVLVLMLGNEPGWFPVIAAAVVIWGLYYRERDTGRLLQD